MKAVYLIFIIFSLIVIGCQSGPQPIDYGNEECDYCKMMISDAQYGSELVTDKGKVYKFDSIECMAAYSMEKDLSDVKYYAANFDEPKSFVNAKEAVFVKSEKLRSPMGMYLSAHKTEDKANVIINEYGGKILKWNEVKELVHTEWLDDTAMKNTLSDNCKCCN